MGAERQRALGQLVQNNVGDNVSMLITHFLSNPSALDGSDYSPDEISLLAESPDYVTTVENWLSELSQEELQEVFEEYDVEDETDILCDVDLMVRIIDANDLDLEYSEALEHWVVSDFLARKLKERGEAVCDDFFNLTIWGRTTSGQAILLDTVIEDIGIEIGIIPPRDE